MEEAPLRDLIKGLEARVNRIEEELWDGERDILTKLAQVQADVGSLKGKLLGYLTAATVLGGVILFLAQLLIGHLTMKP